MSDPITGVTMLIKVNTGTDAIPVWTDVGGQRNATLNRSADEIDASDKTTNGWKTKLAGLKEWSIDADGLYIYDSAGFVALENAFMANPQDQVKIGMITPAGTYYKGDAYITDFPIDAPYDDAATYSVTLSGAGELTNA